MEITAEARLSREKHTAETVAAIQFQNLATTTVQLPRYQISYGLNLRFFGRDTELQSLADSLDPTLGNQLRVVGIYGPGGVGKSQLALHYANSSMTKKSYDLIAWITAETQIKLVQNLSALARDMGLVPKEDEGEYQCVQKVRDWLNSSGHSFLLVFDNVDNLQLLDQIWPASDKGSIIITTRSPAVASGKTTKTLSLGCFPDDVGKDVLVSLAGTTPTGKEDEIAAKEINHQLGGLPLALVAIGDYIRDRGCDYVEFLDIYFKSSKKIIARSKQPVGYDYTLLTTWDISMEKLSDEARVLQNLFAFLDPDVIPERLISGTKAQIDDPRLEFLLDEFEFGEALIDLSRASLITRLPGSKAVSILRLLQIAILSALTPAEKIFFFDQAVRILSFDFPNTWQDSGLHQGHSFESWETCSAILPHVNWMIQLFQKERLQTSDMALWAELVFRSGTYLWEKEQPTLAQSFFAFGLSLGDGSSGGGTALPTPLAAQAFRLLGHISLDLARPLAGLAAYERALSLRLELEANPAARRPDAATAAAALCAAACPHPAPGATTPPSPPPPPPDAVSVEIANVLDSVACALAEACDTARAHAVLDRAAAIHAACHHREPARPARSSRTLAIRAVTCLRAGDARGALGALRACWELQGLAQEDVERSRYPKHSGDVVLLARIWWLLGTAPAAATGGARRDEGGGDGKEAVEQVGGNGEDDNDQDDAGVADDEQSKAELRQLAREVAARSVAIRRGLAASDDAKSAATVGGPRVGDSLFLVACMLADAGEVVSAARMLRDDVLGQACPEGVVETRGHRARALWFLANMEEQIRGVEVARADGVERESDSAPVGDGKELQQTDVEDLRAAAKRTRALIDGREGLDEDTDDSFMSLVAWMLW